MALAKILSNRNKNLIFDHYPWMVYGMGIAAVIVSVHQDFAAMEKFRTLIRQTIADHILGLESFLVDLDNEKDSLPLTFSLLADKIQTSN